MNELEIVYLDPHELTPYENNARKHTPEDIEQIKESIVDCFWRYLNFAGWIAIK